MSHSSATHTHTLAHSLLAESRLVPETCIKVTQCSTWLGGAGAGRGGWGEDGGEGALFPRTFQKQGLVGMLSPFRWPLLREVSVSYRGKGKAEMPSGLHLAPGPAMRGRKPTRGAKISGCLSEALHRGLGFQPTSFRASPLSNQLPFEPQIPTPGHDWEFNPLALARFFARALSLLLFLRSMGHNLFC